MDVRVQSSGGLSATSPNDKYTYGNLPVVTGLSYSVGPAYTSPGEFYTQYIYGANFTGATNVIYGSSIPYTQTDLTSSEFSVNAAGTIIALGLPHELPRTIDVQVVTNLGESLAVPADQFTYTQAPLVLTGGYYGPVLGGASITLTGFNLTAPDDPTGADTAVDFGGVPGTITSVSSSSITVTVPPNNPGPAPEIVTTPEGSSTIAFVPVYTYYAVPTITGISPASGGIGGGNTVAITGTGLSNVGQVYFGGESGHVHRLLGDGIPVASGRGRRYGQHDFRHQPARQRIGHGGRHGHVLWRYVGHLGRR